MHINNTIFLPFLILSLGFFAYSAYSRLLLVKLGKPEHRESDAGLMIGNAFGQKKVVKGSFGFNHFMIFWAFLVLSLANLEFLINGAVPAFSFSKLPAPVYAVLAFMFDIFSFVALVAVVLAMVRKVVAPPYKGVGTIEAYTILSTIGVLMLAYFTYHGAEIALGHANGKSMPISNTFAMMFDGKMSADIESIGVIAWWIHAVALLGFMNYLPYGKHMHILTAIPNSLLGAKGKVNTIAREDFDVDNEYGADSVTDMSWKDLLDSFTCTECGRCQIECPATNTDKPLVPRTMIEKIKYNLLKNAGSIKQGLSEKEPLIGDGSVSISEDEIWSCVTCGACMEQCPVLIEHTPKIIKMRRHLVQMESEFPEELLNLFENIEQRSNPWGMAPSERDKWTTGAEVASFEEGKTEYLYFVGCSGSFDSRSRQVTLAMKEILDASGVTYGILGKDEKCCGDSLRRLGNEYVFDKLAKENVEMFKEKGVKKILTQCPHCYTTLKNDYAQYGLEAEVVHHTEFIKSLVENGKIELKSDDKEGNMVFHDSCYLGRHNDVYEAPREVIKSATGNDALEMDKTREKSFCCGAGGGRMWLEEHTEKRINITRVEQALEQNPDSMCVSCPFCMTMFQDGLKDLGKEELPVYDIAEVVASKL